MEPTTTRENQVAQEAYAELKDKATSGEPPNAVERIQLNAAKAVLGK